MAAENDGTEDSLMRDVELNNVWARFWYWLCDVSFEIAERLAYACRHRPAPSTSCPHIDLDYFEDEEIFHCKDCEEELTSSEAFLAWQANREEQ